MRQRAFFAAPLLVAIALHAWASGAYAQDVFVLALGVAAIPLGGRVALGPNAQRVLAVTFFAAGAAAAWLHHPDLGYGPGTLPRAASLVALGSLLAAVSRLYARAGWTGERATFVFGMLAIAASGATRLGPAYGVFAAVYVAMALVTLRTRDAARARTSQLAPRHHAALVTSIVLTSIIAAALMRMVPPLHDSMQRAFEDAYTMHDMVGFGAGSSLGAMRDMIRSDNEVLRVRPPPHSLPIDYLRGAAYDEYRSDGVWSETPFSERIHEEPVGSDLAPPGKGIRVRRIAGTPNRYFIPLDAREIRVAFGAVDVDELGAVFTVGSERTSEYSFSLGDRDDLIPAPPSTLDMRIPRTEREALAQLVGDWTAGATTDEEKLDALVQHLRHDFHYSLNEVRDADDPLLDFLFRQKVGYCTYFASALAMLGRSAGVATRMVTGYRVSEWSPIAGEYVVREKNAHAWVEAWIRGTWRTYDPTPARELPQDAPHLASVGTLTGDAAQRIGEAVAYAISHVTPAQLGVALVALALLWALVRAAQNRAAAAQKETTVDATDRPLPCFQRLASTLERAGIIRGASESLDRFAKRVDQAGLGEAAQLVARYAALRYGGVGDPSALEADVDRFVSGRVAVR